MLMVMLMTTKRATLSACSRPGLPFIVNVSVCYSCVCS